MIKKIFFILCSLISILLLFFGTSSYALPIINNYSIEKPLIKFGWESNTVFLNCTENGSTVNLSVYADVFTPNNTYLNNSFLQYSNGTYYFVIAPDSSLTFKDIGRYNVTSYCIYGNDTINSTLYFFVVNRSLIKPRPIEVSINATDDGRISFLNYSDEVRQYSRINFTIEFTNIGSTTYTKQTRLEIGVYYPNFTSIANRTGGTNSLNPGQRNLEVLRYTPLTYGFFWLHVVVTYAVNKTADAWGYFYVKPYYEGWYGQPTTPTSSTGGGGGGGVTEERIWKIPLKPSVPNETLSIRERPDTGTIGMEIEYPKEIFINPGESSVLYVIVNNSGTMPLRDLKVLAHIYTDILLDVQPKTIGVLYGNSSAVFMITLDADKDTPKGTYSLDFTVSSNREKKYGHVDVLVGAISTDDSLWRTILNYQYIISRLEDEADELDIEGIDVDKAVTYINDAKNSLKDAKDAYAIKNYDLTRNHLKKTRRDLINTVTELGLARSDRLLVVMAPTIWLLIILIIIMVVSAVSVHVHKHEAENKKKAEENSFENK